MTLQGLFASGHIVDVILAVLIAEAAALIFLRGGKTWYVRSINAVVAALPGVCLLLALRAALTGASWTWIALWLALSFPAHLADLWRRPP